MKVDIYDSPKDEPCACSQVAVMMSAHNEQMPMFTTDGRHFIGTISHAELKEYGYIRVKQYVVI